MKPEHKKAFSDWVAILLSCQQLRAYWSPLELYHFSSMLQNPLLTSSNGLNLISVRRSGFVR
jgi:hypothetical protein